VAHLYGVKATGPAIVAWGGVGCLCHPGLLAAHVNVQTRDDAGHSGAGRPAALAVLWDCILLIRCPSRGLQGTRFRIQLIVLAW
jgi:hypothetical protein